VRFPPLKPATLLERRGPFRVLVELEGRQEEAYLPNSGRLKEVLLPGMQAFVAERGGKLRKTSYDLVLVELAGLLISIDSRVPNELLLESLSSSKLSPFRGYHQITQEVRLPGGRIDFLLTRDLRGASLRPNR